jgi:TnpA family transposase
MTTLDRTAYPRFRRKPLTGEVAATFSLSDEEILLLHKQIKRSAEHRLAFAMLFKSFQHLGYVPNLDEVPGYVVNQLRVSLKLRRSVLPAAVDRMTRQRYVEAILKHHKVHRFDRNAFKRLARQLADAAAVQDHPADIINTGLEALARDHVELPAFSTLDRLARRIRHRVNQTYFQLIESRLKDEDTVRLEAMLELQSNGKSLQYRTKRRARKDSATNFKALLDHIDFLDKLAPLPGVLDGIPQSKRDHFAAEARALDASELRDYAPHKRRALLVCQLVDARVTTRDEILEMYLRRISKIIYAAKEALAFAQSQMQARSELMVATMGDVMRLLAQHAIDADAGREIRRLVETRGGVAALLLEVEEMTKFHGDQHLRFILKPLAAFRFLFMRMLRTLKFSSTSEDTTLIDAIQAVLVHKRGEHLSTPIDLSFTTVAWRDLINVRDGEQSRQRFDYFQAAVFVALAHELRSGDIAVEGTKSFADYRESLVPWSECEPLVESYCAQAGLAADAETFVDNLRAQLCEQALATDESYPENAAFLIDERGEPHLKRYRAKPIPAGVETLAEAIAQRMPERSLVDILWDVNCWTNFTRQFGPISGSDPKLSDPASRYVLTTFAYGSKMGPAQAARHMRGAVSAHQLSFVNRRHVDANKLEAASRDIIDPYSSLHLPRCWGDGSSAAADGTQMDIYEDNLLAAYHFRYGRKGGVAYHHISDTYAALFSHFIACGVWEAVYILDGLIKNTSALQPDRIHADTQGQSAPVFGLSMLMGIELMPRIRNWADYSFFRPDPDVHYTHIDTLFQKTVDWGLIQRHWKDLMQVAISIHSGRVVPSTLLRKLGNDSVKNRLYRAFKALGTATRTLYLLRYIAEESLRVAVTATTNKTESYNGFSKLLGFGGDVIAQNDVIEQEKVIKYGHVLANAVILWNAVQQTRIIKKLRQSGMKITKEQVAFLSPYTLAHIKRFGDYWLEFESVPDPIDGELPLDD